MITDDGQPRAGPARSAPRPSGSSRMTISSPDRPDTRRSGIDPLVPADQLGGLAGERVGLERVGASFSTKPRTTNPHEADAFARKAAELVARHRIDPERLVSGRSDDEIVIRELPLGRGAYVRARLALLTIVGDHHDVRVVFKTLPTGMMAYLAGFRSDVEVVELLYHSLHQQAAAQMAGISRGTGAATQRFRRSFLMGFADRIGVVLDESAREAAAGRSAAVANSTASRCVNGQQQVDDHLQQSFGRIRSARRASAAEASGWQAGVAAAERADVGRDRLPERRALGR